MRVFRLKENITARGLLELLKSDESKEDLRKSSIGLETQRVLGNKQDQSSMPCFFSMVLQLGS